jgi:hypothetical protein
LWMARAVHCPKQNKKVKTFVTRPRF